MTDAVPATRAAVNHRRRIPPFRQWGVGLVVLVLLVCLVALPVLTFEGRILTEPGKIATAWELPGVLQAVGNTFLLASCSVVIALVLGVTLAWCSTRVPKAVAGAVGLFPIVPLILPSVAAIAGWTYLLAPRSGLINQLLRSTGLFAGPTGPINIYSMPWIILLTAFSMTSFVYLFVRSAMTQRGTELEVAAAASGASQWRVFWTITLPLLRPAITYSAGIVFLLGLGQFSAPLLLGANEKIEVVTTLLYRLTLDYPVDYTVAAVLSFPLLIGGIAVVLLQRLSLRDEVRFRSVMGKSGLVQARTSWWAVVPIALYTIVTVVLPVAILVIVSFSPYWSGAIRPEVFSLVNWQSALGDSAVLAAIRTSAIAIGVSLLLVIPLGYLASAAQLRRSNVPRPIRTGIDFLSNMSLALPHAVFGIAFLFVYSGAPFFLYGTAAMLVVAYVTLMVPYAIRPQLSSMLLNGNDFVEASKTSGAGPLRTAFSIDLPLARPGISVAAALVVIMLLHEFAASLLIVSADTNVIATLLYLAWTSGGTARIAVLALISVVVTVIALVITGLLAGTRALREHL